MSKEEYDTSQPILVIVRRGRRGFTVAPADNPTDVSACADVEAVGDVIIEILDDKSQPRVDIGGLLSAARDDVEDAEDDEEESEELDEADEEDDEDEGEDDDVPWYKAKDPADALLIGLLTGAATKARKASRSSRRRGGGRRAKSRKRKKS